MIMTKVDTSGVFFFFDSLKEYADPIMSAYTKGIMLANCAWKKIFEESEYSEFTNQLFAMMTYIPSLIIGFKCVKRIITVTWHRKSKKIEELRRLEIQLGVVRERVRLAEQSIFLRKVRLRACASRLSTLRARVHAGLHARPCLHLHRHHLDAWEARFQREVFMEGDADRDIMLSTSTIFDYNNPLEEEYSVDSEQGSQQSMNMIHNTAENTFFIPSTDRQTREISIAANYPTPSEHSLGATHSSSRPKGSDVMLRRTSSAVHIQITALQSDHDVSSIINEWKMGSMPVFTVDIKKYESHDAEQLNHAKVEELTNFESYNASNISRAEQSTDSIAVLVGKESSESMIQTYVNHLWETKSDLDNTQHESPYSEPVSSATDLSRSHNVLYGQPINETIIDVMAKFYGLIDRNPIIEPSMVDNCFQNYQKYFEKSYLEQYGKRNGFIDKTSDSYKMLEINNGNIFTKETKDTNRGLFVVREETNSEVEVEEEYLEKVSDEEWHNSDTLSDATENSSYGTLLADFKVKYMSGDCAGDCEEDESTGKVTTCSGPDKHNRSLGLTEICIQHFTE